MLIRWEEQTRAHCTHPQLCLVPCALKKKTWLAGKEPWLVGPETQGHGPHFSMDDMMSSKTLPCSGLSSSLGHGHQHRAMAVSLRGHNNHYNELAKF